MVHRRARRVQRGAALAVTHMAPFSCTLQKAAAVAAILANNTKSSPCHFPSNGNAESPLKPSEDTVGVVTETRYGCSFTATVGVLWLEPLQNKNLENFPFKPVVWKCVKPVRDGLGSALHRQDDRKLKKPLGPTAPSPLPNPPPPPLNRLKDGGGS